jgi:hypothetical protein
MSLFLNSFFLYSFAVYVYYEWGIFLHSGHTLKVDYTVDWKFLEFDMLLFNIIYFSKETFWPFQHYSIIKHSFVLLFCILLKLPINPVCTTLEKGIKWYLWTIFFSKLKVTNFLWACESANAVLKEIFIHSD